MSAVHATRTSQDPSPSASRRLSKDGCTRPTRTALQIAPGIGYTAWRRVGSQLALIADSSSWWLGDWIVYGQGQYGKRYLEAIEATQLDYQTLRNYAWVARKFEPPRRRESLSFQHHVEVAGLPTQDQETWLDRAHIYHWSRTTLRNQVRMVRRHGNEPAITAVDTVTISVDPGRRTRWAEAAAADAHDLGNWILDALDEAATRRLTHGPDTDVQYPNSPE
jgi:hypothetical protein